MKTNSAAWINTQGYCSGPETIYPDHHHINPFMYMLPDTVSRREPNRVGVKVLAPLWFLHTIPLCPLALADISFQVPQRSIKYSCF